MPSLPPTARPQAPLSISSHVTPAHIGGTTPARRHWFTKSKNARLALVNARLLNIREHVQQTQARPPTSAWLYQLGALEGRFGDFEAHRRAHTCWKRFLGGRSERKQVELFHTQIDNILDQLEFEAAARDAKEGWFDDLLGCVWQMLTLE